MAVQKLNSQFTLINAPAGSGKTTSIKRYIDELTNNYPNEYLLCLTFTNRAVDELKTRVYNRNVDIYTIHEYCNKILSTYYKTNEAKNLFCEMFDEQISDILNMSKEKDADKVEKYKEKFKISIVTKEIIKENIKEIKYNQTNFTSYLYGTLSHADLLNFIYKFSTVYPKFLDKISKKYKFIFIDEYQDTSSNILKMVYRACVVNRQHLILFGDKRLLDRFNKNYGYENYNIHFHSFRHTFATLLFEKKVNPKIIQLLLEHKSVKTTLEIYNNVNIYNDEMLKIIQDAFK